MRLRDAEALHALYSNAEAMQFLTPEVPTSVEGSRAWVRSKIERFERDDGLSLWAVVERATNDVVGDAGLQWEEYEGQRVLDLGCRLIPAYWGRGFAVEVSRAILEAGFRDVPVDEIVATTGVANDRARRVLERLGGRYERDVQAFGFTMALYSFTRADA